MKKKKKKERKKKKKSFFFHYTQRKYITLDKVKTTKITKQKKKGINFYY